MDIVHGFAESCDITAVLPVVMCAVLRASVAILTHVYGYVY